MNVGMLYELLDRLPDACDGFVVRFTPIDRSGWLDPESYSVKHGVLFFEDGTTGTICVAYMKDILDGMFNEQAVESEEIYPDMDVMIDFGEAYYRNPLRKRFEINWKRERVDVFVD